jgi:hypothetical protein
VLSPNLAGDPQVVLEADPIFCIRDGAAQEVEKSAYWSCSRRQWRCGADTRQRPTAQSIRNLNAEAMSRPGDLAYWVASSSLRRCERACPIPEAVRWGAGDDDVRRSALKRFHQIDSTRGKWRFVNGVNLRIDKVTHKAVDFGGL